MALVSGTASLRDIAGQFRVGRSALSRHVKGGHIAEELHKSKNAHEIVAADNLLARILKRQNRLDEMAEEARKFGDPELELKVHREAGRFMELEGKTTGSFREKIEHTGTIPLQIKVVRVD